jgi:hypothetical protein
MRGAAMLEKKNSLPGAELHFSIDNRDGFARLRQDHSNVRWHVIAAFRAVREVIGIFRHQVVEELLEVASRRWVDILHNNHTATRVLNKNRDRSAAQSAFVDLLLDLVGDFVRSPTIGAELKLVVVDAHKIGEAELQGQKSSRGLIFAPADDLMTY